MVFAGLALLVVLALLFDGGGKGDPPIFLVAFVPLVAAVVYVNFGLRCPRCKGNLAMTPAAYPSFSTKHRFNYCPYCGVSVDDQL
jgi:hypothetical protein